jgi:hypothetical protein
MVLKKIQFLATCSILFSCSSEVLQIKMRVLQSEQIQIIPKPTLMDLEIKEKKVKAEAIGSLHKSTVDGLKEKALYEAIKTSGADILVEPHYETVKEGGKITVTVTGFPAIIKSFRPVADTELPLLNMNDKLVAKYYPVIKLPIKK